MTETNEFSFILKPSEHGVGVFALHDIPANTYLRLFGDKNPRRFLRIDEVPEDLKGFCANRGDHLICPPDFGYMPVGWYLNHSKTPNAEPRGGYNEQSGYRFYAIQDIKSGEEVCIDYNSLEEPEEAKANYYKS
jgi:SET domain-containing protein